MHIKLHSNRVVLLLTIFTVLLSNIVFAVNYIFFKYHGNNYFPNNIFVIGLIIFLFNIGLRIQLGNHNKYLPYLADLAWYYVVLLVIAFATNAVQLTPFAPIDRQILAFEKLFGINLLNLVIWAKEYKLLLDILYIAYDFLTYQMVILPLCAIVLGMRDELREYYILLLLTILIGFSFYYFYPTTAPASVFPQEYFSSSQVATGLKFTQIHNHLLPSTIEGGLIALPSFHVIWAWLSLYLIRRIRILFAFLVPINILIVLSCVLLGWHYLSDVLASVLVLAIASFIYKARYSRLFNRSYFSYFLHSS